MRIIARLDVKPPNVVKPVFFEGLRKIDTPQVLAEKYFLAGADEIIYIDIVSSLYQRDIVFELIHEVSRELYIPYGVGGGIRSVEIVQKLIHNGADKVILNTKAIDDPALIENAIEEYARFFPPVVALGRTCTRDIEIAGTQIKEGEFVMLTYAAASRDPRHMEDPGKIDLKRTGIPHSTFGVGRHRCIGSNLARIELSATLEEWLKRIPEFSVKHGTTPTYVTGYLRSIRKLELTW